MGKHVEFRPGVVESLEERVVPSTLTVRPATNVKPPAMMSVQPNRAQNRALTAIHNAYVQYYHELQNACRDGSNAIANRTRTPAHAFLGFRNFAAQKEAYLERQIVAAVAKLPNAAQIAPNLIRVARATLEALNDAPDLKAACDQVTVSNLSQVFTVSRAIVLGQPLPVAARRA
jgi:hypothetical protein